LAAFIVNMVTIFAVFPACAFASDIQSGDDSGFNIITSVPRAMSYQGILKDSGGEPVTDSVYNVTFRIYDAENGGVSEWSQVLPCTTSTGYFTALLSNVNIPFDEDYWVELEVDGEILTPRQKITMVGYSARSDTSDYATAGGGWIDDGLNVRLEASYDKVGIGTSTPTNKLHVTGSESVPVLNVEQYGSHRAARFYSQNVCALWVDYAGNHGLRVTQAAGDGVHIEYAGNNGIMVDSSNNYAGYFVGRGYFSGPLGVGTSSPQATLHVEGMGRFDSLMMPTGASDGYVLTADGTGRGTWQAAPGGGDSDWVISDTNMYSGVMGNVGIGTTTPDEKLDINGNLKVGGNATIGPGHTNSGSGSTIAGGGSNTTVGGASFIGAGQLNNANGSLSVIGGGISNDADGSYSVVGGGNDNTADGQYASILGGFNNSTSNNYCSIGGGGGNSAAGDASTIAGGYYNTTSNNYSAVGGGTNNKALGQASYVGGGLNNVVEGSWSAILGGMGDTITSTATRSYLFGINSRMTQPSTFMVDMPHIWFGPESTGYEFPVSDGSSGQVMATDGSGQLSWTSAAGGNWSVTDQVLYTNDNWGLAKGNANNVLYGDSAFTMVNLGVACTTGYNSSNVQYATISGGYMNKCITNYTTIGGGYRNIGWGGGNYQTISGGSENETSGYGSAVGGGWKNKCQSGMSVIAGGGENYILGYGTVISGGVINRNLGDYSAIVGGDNDTLDYNADHSMVFGKGVYLNNPYRVAFFDSVFQGKLSINRDDRNGAISVPIQAGTSGGGGGGGAYLSWSGTWTNASSRSFKDNFKRYDRHDLLERISSMPMEFWVYRNSDERHFGPMAEDFVAAFDVGIIRETDGQREDQYLAAGDVAGVALAGVKELIEIVNELREENIKLKSRIEELETRIK